MKIKKNKIKILYIMRNYQAGGAEMFLISLIKQFDKEKFSFSIATIYGGGSLKPSFTSLGVKTYELHFKNFFDIKSYIKLLRIIKENNYDIVHTKLFHADIIGRISAFICRVPIIISTVENAWEWEKDSGIKQKIKNFLFKFTSLCNYTVIAVTNKIYKLLIDNVGINKHLIKVIYNGVNLTEFKLINSEYNILKVENNLPTNVILIGAVGSLSPIKNHAMMIKAAKIVLSFRKDIYFFIAGKGDARDLKNFALELGVSDHVVFLGERNDIPEILRGLDVYVMTSLSEGLSISLLEAMASAKAVIATNVGGNSEIINNSYCGLLIDSNDDKALAANILELASDENQRQKLGIHARKRVHEAFDIESVVKEYTSLYITAVSQ